jgi:hypothetical protein
MSFSGPVHHFFPVPSRRFQPLQSGRRLWDHS